MTEKALVKLFLVYFLITLRVSYAFEYPIFISIDKSITLLNPKTQKTSTLRPQKNQKIKIIRDRDWAYIIKIENSGRLGKQEYHTSKEMLNQALIYQIIHEVTTFEENKPCKQRFQTPSHHSYQWQENCHILEHMDNLSKNDYPELKQCITSIQNFITDNGKITYRNEILKNLYQLNPKEQRFAAMIFTMEGEAKFLAAENDPPQAPPPHLEEMLGVMKVIDNRLRNANENHENNPNHPFNELDIVLDPEQFSMYNHDDPNWKDVMTPKKNRDFSYAIEAFVNYPSAVFEPQSKINNIYHYHTNYVNPKKIWKRSCGSNAHKKNRVPVTINGKSLKRPRGRFNEDTSRGRKMTSRYIRHVRHIYFHAVDSCGNKNSADPWKREVITPCRN